MKFYGILADCFADQEFQCIKHDVDEELRMVLGRVLKPCIGQGFRLWSPVRILSLVCVKMVFLVVFSKLVGMAFGKHSQDQAFSRIESDNFPMKVCAKVVSSNTS